MLITISDWLITYNHFRLINKLIILMNNDIMSVIMIVKDFPNHTDVYSQFMTHHYVASNLVFFILIFKLLKVMLIDINLI